MKTLTVIAPVYNEASIIDVFYRELKSMLDSLQDRYRSKILFVVDRGTDRSEEILREIASHDSSVGCLFLSSRFGHQMSLLAGIDHSDTDVIIMMDSDMQHPPATIPVMLEEYEKGNDIVYTTRIADKESGFIARAGAHVFYWLIARLTPVPIRENAADFRLISRRVAQIFQNDIRERQQFLRGLFAWIGFPSTSVKFQCDPRRGGKSKYTARRRFQFAAAGIISFSRRPLQLAFYFGLLMAVSSLLLALYILLTYIMGQQAPPGWFTLAILVPFLSGAQLIFLGVIGEYIGAIFEEVKARPHYLVQESVNLQSTTQLHDVTGHGRGNAERKAGLQ